MKSRRGFTLIELLVVIAIIAILAAILFPVFAKAREKARQTACLSNVKQIMLGFHMYMEDYDSTFPNIVPGGYTRALDSTPGGFPQQTDASYPGAKYASGMFWGNGGNMVTWMDAIFPYVKNVAIFKCPSQQRAPGAAGYGYNAAVGGWGQFFCALSPAARGTAAGVPASFNMPLSEGQITHPADLIVLCDQNSAYLYATPADAIGWETTYRAFPPDPYAPHNDGGNMGFADGHAKWAKIYSGEWSVTQDPAYDTSSTGTCDFGPVNCTGWGNKHWNPFIP